MLRPATPNLPPHELLIDFTEDVAVVGFAPTVGKNESLGNMPVPMSVPSPIRPESDALISFESDSDIHSKSNIKSKNSKVPTLSATAPVFTPMAISGAISGILISFDDDVKVVPVAVAPVMASSDQDLDKDLSQEDQVVEVGSAAVMGSPLLESDQDDRDLQREDQVVEVDLAAMTGVTSAVLSQTANENKVFQLKDQEIVAVPSRSVNTPGASDNMEVDSTGIPMDAEPSGVQPALHSDNDGPDSHKHARLVDDGSVVLVPGDVSPLDVSPKVVVDLDDRTAHCVQELRMLLEKHLETTIRV
jgi:hypothetical protein